MSKRSEPTKVAAACRGRRGHDKAFRQFGRIRGEQLAVGIVQASEFDRRLLAERSQKFRGRFRVVELDGRRRVGAQDRGQGGKLPDLRGADHLHVVDEEGDARQRQRHAGRHRGQQAQFRVDRTMEAHEAPAILAGPMSDARI